MIVKRKRGVSCGAIRVRVEFTPLERELLPGRPFPEAPAWSELKYQAYCWVMPKFGK